jgi:hypothetical protein
MSPNVISHDWWRLSRRIRSGCLAVFAVASAISAAKGFLGLQLNNLPKLLTAEDAEYSLRSQRKANGISCHILFDHDGTVSQDPLWLLSGLRGSLGDLCG